MSIYVALLAGCVLTMILGKFVLAELRKLKAGQEIRQDGPTWHNSKAGTPTMGGIAFILGSGIVTFACGWQQMLAGDFAHLYVYLFALIFGLIGFVDDYRKVRQHQNEGLTAKQKFVLQLLAAVVFLCLMRYEGLLTNDLYIPFVNVTLTVNWIVYLIFAAFVIIGTVNAVNITDGIDGLSSSVTVPVAVFFAVLGGMWQGFGQLGVFAGALVGGLLGFLLGSLGLGGIGLGRLRLGDGLHGKHLLQRRDLVGLGHAVKHQIQFLIGEHLRIGLGLLKILGDDVRDHLRRNAEVCRDLLQTILH